jgi:hypothetical protein
VDGLGLDPPSSRRRHVRASLLIGVYGFF